MATMRENRPDSDIYEDTVVMPVPGTSGPQARDVNTLYEPLRMEEGELRQVHTARTRRGKCGKGRWLTVTAVVIAILSIGLSSFVTAQLIELKKQTAELVKKMETDRMELSATEMRLTKSETEMAAIRVEQSATDEAKVVIETRVTEIDSILYQKTAAFSVYPSAQLLDLASGAVVPFNSVIVDSMAGFDADEHQYTCKIPGTYYFSLCINNGLLGGGFSANSGMYLEVGGNKIMGIYSYNDDAAHYTRDQACNAAVYKCSAGSTVRVKCNYASRIMGTINQPVSILSGFLIYPQ